MTNTSTTATDTVLTLQNRPFCAYLICSCILVLKMMALALFTMRKRMVTKAFPSPEDASFNKVEAVTTDDRVERARRAHLNDLENIPIFWASAFAYLFTKPSTTAACILFFTFALVRIFHTIVYAVWVLPQPSRAIMFLTGFLITGYLTTHSMIVGFAHMFK